VSQPDDIRYGVFLTPDAKTSAAVASITGFVRGRPARRLLAKPHRGLANRRACATPTSPQADPLTTAYWQETSSLEAPPDGGMQRIFRCPSCQVAVNTQYGHPGLRLVRGALDQPVEMFARCDRGRPTPNSSSSSAWVQVTNAFR
jgi:hypothetical protein